MEFYSVFRSAEILTPLSILKEMVNKNQILLYQHIFDDLNISKNKIEENLVLNFLYVYKDRNTQKHYKDHHGIWNCFANVMELLWNDYLVMLSGFHICLSMGWWFMRSLLMYIAVMILYSMYRQNIVELHKKHVVVMKVYMMEGHKQDRGQFVKDNVVVHMKEVVVYWEEHTRHIVNFYVVKKDMTMK